MFPAQLKQQRPMNYPQMYQSTSNPINIPVSFSYSQHHQNPKLIGNYLSSNPTPIRTIVPTIIAQNVPFISPSKQTSQVLYATHSLPQFTSSAPSHHSQINQPKILSPRHEMLHTQNLSNNYSDKVPSSRPNLLNRNLYDYRKNVSPLNNTRVLINSPLKNLTQDKELLKHDALRWQRKYQDLKTKYFELLTIVENHSNIENSWLLEEQNKLLREKVKLLQEKDQKYYNQVTKRIEKMIDFHKQTTTQECALLIDRYKLQSKYLQKI